MNNNSIKNMKKHQVKNGKFTSDIYKEGNVIMTHLIASERNRSKQHSKSRKNDVSHERNFN